MHCTSCGMQLPDRCAFCPGCGTAISGPVSHAGASLADASLAIGERVGSQVKSRSVEAWKGIKLLARSPVGGLQASFEALDPTRAMGAAVTFAVLYELMLVLGIYRASARLSDGLSLPLISLGDHSLKQTLTFALAGLTPVFTLTVAASLARLLFRGKGTFVGDLYTASASLLPLGFLILVAALLGPGNLEVIHCLAVFAFTYSILMLYAGCSRIAGIPETGAAPAVPVMLLLAAWLTKIVLAIVI